MKKIIIIISVFIISINIFTQTKNYQNEYNLTHSVGIGFKQSEVTFYLSLTRSINKNFSAGLKGGIYNFSENTVGKIIDTFIAPIYEPLNPGHYSMEINKMTVQGTTYAGGLTGVYKLPSLNFLLRADIGLKFYNESNYSLTISFDKSTQNQPSPKREQLYLGDLTPYEINTVIKPYFSAGIDYTIGFVNLGVYADNIFSAGLNIGVSF